MGRTPWITVLVLALCLLVLATGTGAKKPRKRKAATKTPRLLRATATPSTSTTTTEELLTTITELLTVKETVQEGSTESMNLLSDYSIENITAFSPDIESATASPLSPDTTLETLPSTTFTDTTLQYHPTHSYNESSLSTTIEHTTTFSPGSEPSTAFPLFPDTSPETQHSTTSTDTTLTYNPTHSYNESSLSTTAEQFTTLSLLDELVSKDQKAETTPQSLREDTSFITFTTNADEPTTLAEEPKVEDTTESTNLLFDSSTANITAFSLDTEPASAFPLFQDTTPQTFQTYPSTTVTDTTLTFNPTFNYNKTSLSTTTEQSTSNTLLNKIVSEDFTTPFPFDTTLQYLTLTTPIETNTETDTSNLFLTSTTTDDIPLTTNTTDSPTTAIFLIPNDISTSETPDTVPTSTNTNDITETTETSLDSNLTTTTFPIAETKTDDVISTTLTPTTDSSSSITTTHIPSTTTAKTSSDIYVTANTTTTLPNAETKTDDVISTTLTPTTDSSPSITTTHVPSTTTAKIYNDTYATDDTTTLSDSYPLTISTTLIPTTDDNSSITTTHIPSTTTAKTSSDTYTTDDTTTLSDSYPLTNFTTPTTTVQVDTTSTNPLPCDIELTVNASVSEDVKQLILVWEKVPNVEAELYYKVQVKPKTCIRFPEGRIDMEDEDLVLDISCFNTRFTINVSAVCEGEIEGEVTTIVVWTPPEAPKNVKIVAEKTDSLFIEWEPPPKKQRDTQKFRVSLNNIIIHEDIKTTAYLIEGLESDTNYSVKVSASNRNVWSRWSDEIFGTTLKKPLEVPVVELGSVTQTSIEVKWPGYKVTSIDTLFEVLCNHNGKSFSKSQIQYLSYNITHLDSYTNYSILVRAYAKKQISPWSKTVEARTLPKAPSEPRDLQAVVISNTSIVLVWNEPSFIQEPILEYHIQWTDYEEEEPEIANTSLLSFTVEGLRPFTDYWVDVYAVTETMRGKASRIEVMTDTGFPSSPEDLSVVNVTNTSISVIWGGPFLPNGHIEYYLVQWRNQKDGETKDNKTTENTFDIEGLRPYSNYSIKVRAATMKGEGEWSQAVTETTKVGIPFKPRDLKITNVSATAITVCWLPPDTFVGPLSYFVEIRRPDEDFRETGETTKECYEISKLRPYSHYSVRVTAATEVGKGEPSDAISIKTKADKPFAPRNVTVKSTEQQNLTVCWEEPSPFVGPVLSYAVAIRRSEREKWTRKGITDKTCFTITELSPYTEYLIQVRAETEAGKGQPSEFVTTRTAIGNPSVPRNFILSSLTNTSISVSWTDPERPNGPHLTYIVRWSNPKKMDDFFETKDIKENRYTIKDLFPYTKYNVKVSASTSAGMGPWTQPLEIKTDEGVPSEPRSLSVSSVTNSSATVMWLPPDPEVGVIINYSVQCSTGGTIVFLNNTKKSGTSIGDLLPYTNYTVRVKAATKAGEGPWSEGSRFRTLSGVPSSPTKVTAIPASNTTVKLTWSAPVPFRGPIKSYAILLKTGGKTVREDTTSSREHLVLNLLPDTMYSFQVQAKTEAGPGEWSKKVDAKTYIGIPTEPREVVTSNKTAWSIFLMWQPPIPSNGPIEKYIVEWGVVGDKKGRSDDTNETTFEAESLVPYTKYYFRVSAETPVGRGPSSKQIVEQTKIAKPSEPTNLTSSASSSSSLQVAWDLPVHPNGPLQNYRVQWRASDLKNKEEEAVVNETHWTISSLGPYTNYTVKVAASTSAGFGPWTEEVVTRTDVAVPSPAHVSSVVVSGPRSLSVKWQAVGPFPGPCNTTLEVYRRPGPCEPPGGPLEVAALRTTQDAPFEWGLPEKRNVEGLIPHSIYYVRVMMETEAGKSVSKDSLDFWTLSDVPGPPAVVEADCSSSSTEAEVRWSPPRYPNGQIEEYMVMYGIESFEWHEQLVRVENKCGDQRLKIINLRPEKKYTIRVRAKVKNVSFEGPPASLGDFCVLPAGVPPLGEGSARAWGSGPHSLTIEWWKDAFSEEMGALVNFAILIGTAVGNATFGAEPEDHPTWGNFTRGNSKYYQTTPLNWNPFNKDLRDPLSCDEVVSEELKRPLLRCVIGIGDSCNTGGLQGYCNGPLNPDTTYGVKLVAFTRGGFAETDPFFASTSTIPSSSWVGVLVGSLIVFLLVGAVVGYVLVLKRKGKLQQVRDILMFRIGKRETPPLPPVEQVLQMETAQLPKSLTVQNFAKHVRIMMSDSHLRFSQEFEALKRNSPKFPCTIAEMDENRAKNRWLNIFPYDHSRVKLLPLGDDPTSDYINANYIPGHSSLREYIASQGPLASTVDDFWRLVWEQSVNMLVMLTQCVERGKNKCEQYWPPPAEAKHYGDLQVRSISESMLSCYTIRMFHLQLGPQERRVKQLHFTHWPDFGCPENPEVLINFVRAVRDHLPRLRPGPILVHCSAGVGRTGTFIAVDRHSQQLPHTDLIDVYGTVMEMRQHRINMVQTEDQYIYIHSCIEQLINERNQPDEKEYEEAIYSNIGVEHDTGF